MRRIADGVQHLDHRSRRAAMQGTLQGADPGQHGRRQARACGGHHSRRERRGVEAMIGDGHQIGIERAASAAEAGAPRVMRRMSAAWPRVGSGAMGASPAWARITAG